MPGLVGLVTRMPRQRAEPELRRMVEALRHEPFYGTGTWMDESLGVYVGWTVRRRSFADGMPLSNERGDVVLVFSGEEFPEPGTAARLRARGHRLDGPGPAYLVHLYEDDRAFPAPLNGRFHGLVGDRARGTATLFNDRYGMHRLYYHEGADGFYFAAEAKAILEVRPELRRADLRALGELVACGCVLEDRSLFAGIGVLPGGAAWRFRDGALAGKATYFAPAEWEEQEVLEPGAYARQVRDVFARNLPRYFEGTERVAMSLTGGLDTRAIMAWHRASPGALPCYTFGGTIRESRDVRVARAVARACGQPHAVIRVGEGFLSRFARYAERTVYLTDGCADVSRAPDLYANEQARDFGPVRMTGNYGGEVLRRVRAFAAAVPHPELFSGDFLPHLRAAGATYAALGRAHPVSFAVFRQAPWHHHGLLALEQTQLAVRSPYLDNDLVRTVFRGPAAAFASSDLCRRLIGDGPVDLRGIATDRGLRAGRGGRLSAADRVVGLLREAEFKAEYAYDYGMPGWLARADHLVSPLRPERLFLGRHKFAHFRVWYRDALAGYLRDVLLDPRALSRPYVDRRRLEAMVRAHVTGAGNHTRELHRVLTLELIHRLFLDSR
jgi:asparagine synthase (glutamine-hydrolysing)